jgi:hypothetical protein
MSTTTTARRIAGGGTASPLAKPGRRAGPPPDWNTEAWRARHQERVRHALQLREAGKSYEQIAREMGVGLGTAHRWCREALATLPSESAEAMRKLALVRCERVMAGLMARLQTSDVTLALIDDILRVQVQLAKLHGFVLDDSDGGGLTINVELPAPRPQKQAPRQAARAKAIG